jgi:regulator of protease activity HflC (stomatin/prohibitin superfamily)
MTNPDLNEEIKDIGSHLDDMKQKRKSRKKHAESKGDAADETPQAEADSDISDEELSALKAMLAEFDAEELIDTVSTHAKAWLGTLNEDLKHTKPSTLLTVFGLGVIVGRMTK